MFIVGPKMDQFKHTGKDFYDDLSRGKVDAKDFERYVYGDGKNQMKGGYDERDTLEKKTKKELREWASKWEALSLDRHSRLHYLWSTKYFISFNN